MIHRAAAGCKPWLGGELLNVDGRRYGHTDRRCAPARDERLEPPLLDRIDDRLIERRKVRSQTKPAELPDVRHATGTVDEDFADPRLKAHARAIGQSWVRRGDV